MNYLIPDSDRTLFVTHEANYRNLKVYSSGKQLIHLADASVLSEGYTLQNDDLGELNLGLFKKGRILEIRVNGMLCSLENPTAISKDNLMGLSSVFRVVAIISTIGIAIQFFSFLQLGLEVAQILLVLFFSILSTALYYLAMIFTKRGKVWAYFVGTGIFLIMTLIYTVNILASGIFEYYLVLFSVFLICRFGILILLLYYFKSVIRVMNGPKDISDEYLLDSL